MAFINDLLCKLFAAYNMFSSVAVGILLFYVCMIVYLYGDLAIYAVAVPETLRDVVWYVSLISVL